MVTPETETARVGPWMGPEMETATAEMEMATAEMEMATREMATATPVTGMATLAMETEMETATAMATETANQWASRPWPTSSTRATVRIARSTWRSR
jgi:hypothetical protein